MPMLYKESQLLQSGGQKWPPPGFVNKVLLEHSHSHLLPVCSTTGKLKNYNRIVHKAYNIFCLDPCKKKKSLLTPTLKEQKTKGHSDGSTMQVNEGEKAEV